MTDYGPNQFESIRIGNEKRQDEMMLPLLKQEGSEAATYVEEAIEEIGGWGAAANQNFATLVDEKVRDMLASHRFYNGIAFYVDFERRGVAVQGWHVAKNMSAKCREYRREKLERFRKHADLRKKIEDRRALSYRHLKETLRTKRVVIPKGLIEPLRGMCRMALSEVPTNDNYRVIAAYMEALHPRDEERVEPASIDDQLDVYSE